MGTPIKVTAEGKTFYLCCKGCKKDVDADPKAVVAKLGASERVLRGDPGRFVVTPRPRPMPRPASGGAFGFLRPAHR